MNKVLIEARSFTWHSPMHRIVRVVNERERTLFSMGRPDAGAPPVNGLGEVRERMKNAGWRMSENTGSRRPTWHWSMVLRVARSAVIRAQRLMEPLC